MTTQSRTPWSGTTLFAHVAFIAFAGACSPQVVNAVGGEDCVCAGGSSGTAGSGPAGAGAGVSGSAGSGGAGGDASRGALLHRYSFDGNTAEITDSISGKHGNAVNALPEGGTLTLTGQAFPMQYVELPSFMISKLEQATIEVWVTWTATGGSWQRVFDFGEDYSGVRLGPEPRLQSDEENERFGGILYSGRSYLYLTPSSQSTPTNDAGDVIRLAYLKPIPVALRGPNAPSVHLSETTLELAGPLPPASEVHLVVTIGDGIIRVYADGEPQGEVPLPHSLAEIHDVNCWLGRSQYGNDALFAGTYNEFRIYDVALTPEQIQQSDDAGADTVAVP